MTKIIGEEHLHFDGKGNLLGLYHVDVQKARTMFHATRFWEGVDNLIKEYALIHPGEVQLQAIDNKLTRDTNREKTGATKTGAIRHALSLPVALHSLLIEYEPTMFTNRKFLHEFMKRYPIFRACDTV